MALSDLVAHLHSIQHALPTEWDPSAPLSLNGRRYVPLLRTVASKAVGLLCPEALKALKADQCAQDQPIFEFKREAGEDWAVLFAPDFIAASHVERTAAIDGLAQRLRRDSHMGLHKRWHKEYATVFDDEGAVFDINRALSRPLGIPICYSNVAAFGYKDGAMVCHVAQRAATKYPNPGKLDATAGGGLVAGECPIEGAVRELQEEAGIKPDCSRPRLVPIGSCSIVKPLENGLFAGVAFVYELELKDMAPTPNDGEVESFVIMTPDEILDAIAKDRFMPGAEYIWLALLAKHGYLDDRDDKDDILALIRNPAIAIPCL